MISRLMKINSAALSLATIVLSGACLSSRASAADGLAVGTCVTVQGLQSPGQITGLTRGGYIVQTEGKSPSEAMNWTTTRVEPGPCPAVAAAPAQKFAQANSCPTDAGGTNAVETSFRGAIRRNLEQAAAPGMDGAITVSFQSVAIGAARGWSISDEISIPAADHTKPIYPLRATLTFCTDFRSAIELRKQESNFTCYTAAATSTADCIMTGGGRMEPTQRVSK
jgi:hypothetical protein